MMRRRTTTHPPFALTPTGTYYEVTRQAAHWRDLGLAMDIRDASGGGDWIVLIVDPDLMPTPLSGFKRVATEEIGPTDVPS